MLLGGRWPSIYLCSSRVSSPTTFHIIHRSSKSELVVGPFAYVVASLVLESPQRSPLLLLTHSLTLNAPSPTKKDTNATHIDVGWKSNSPLPRRNWYIHFSTFRFLVATPTHLRLKTGVEFHSGKAGSKANPSEYSLRER